MRFLYFLVSFLLSSIPTFGFNHPKGYEANRKNDSQSLLVLHKYLPIKNGNTHNAHSSHMAHVSHAAHASHYSHYSGVVVTADSTANLTQRQISFIKQGLYQTFKNNKRVELLRAYKSNRGSVHHDLSSSPLYGVKNVLYLKFSVNGNIYEYLIPRDKEINTFRIVTDSKEYTKNKYDWMNKIDEK